MQRAAAVETDVVGNIDECIDGPKADGDQTLLQPGGRGGVADAANVAASKTGAGVGGLGRKLQFNFDRTVEAPLDAARCALGLELAETGGRKIARNTPDAGAIGPIW